MRQRLASLGLVVIAAAVAVGIVVQRELARSVLPSPGPSAMATTTTKGGVIYYTSGTNRLTGVDWAGHPAGSVQLPHPGLTVASPSGDLLLVWPDLVDRRGHVIGAVTIDSEDFLDAAWAPSENHLCILGVAHGRNSSSGGVNLFIGGPTQPFRRIAGVGKPGSIPSIAACDPAGSRVVIVDVQKRQFPRGGESFPTTVGVLLLNPSDGSPTYSRDYAPGVDKTSATTVVASDDGRYLAENRNGNTTIRSASSGGVLTSMSGFTVLSITGGTDPTLAGLISGNQPEVRDLSDRVVWRSAGLAQWALSEPGASAVIFGLIDEAGGLNDLVAVSADGASTVLARNVFCLVPCPCPGANAM